MKDIPLRGDSQQEPQEASALASDNSPDTIYALFSTCGRLMPSWSSQPFEGAIKYVKASIPGDQNRKALEWIAKNGDEFGHRAEEFLDGDFSAMEGE